MTIKYFGIKNKTNSTIFFEVNIMQIFFITGASGVGKTTLIELVKEKYDRNNCVFLHFDSIGIPSVEKMIEQYGSPSAFQQEMTNQWIDKLINDYKNMDLIFFEGQVNLQFIKDGFEKHHFTNFTILLIDCSNEAMNYRLTKKRLQPELLTPEMANWLAFLRKQASDMGIRSIDTSLLTKEQMLQQFEEVGELHCYFSKNKNSNPDVCA
ncbi:MAG: AAA family ATPase [Tatlockia sp.]|nr:AAA family ATPase [Tatlockia sp.]